MISWKSKWGNTGGCKANLFSTTKITKKGFADHENIERILFGFAAAAFRVLSGFIFFLNKHEFWFQLLLFGCIIWRKHA